MRGDIQRVEWLSFCQCVKIALLFTFAVFSLQWTREGASRYTLPLVTRCFALGANEELCAPNSTYSLNGTTQLTHDVDAKHCMLKGSSLMPTSTLLFTLDRTEGVQSLLFLNVSFSNVQVVVNITSRSMFPLRLALADCDVTVGGAGVRSFLSLESGDMWGSLSLPEGSRISISGTRFNCSFLAGSPLEYSILLFGSGLFNFSDTGISVSSCVADFQINAKLDGAKHAFVRFLPSSLGGPNGAGRVLLNIFNHSFINVSHNQASVAFTSLNSGGAFSLLDIGGSQGQIEDDSRVTLSVNTLKASAKSLDFDYALFELEQRITPNNASIISFSADFLIQGAASASLTSNTVRADSVSTVSVLMVKGSSLVVANGGSITISRCLVSLDAGYLIEGSPDGGGQEHTGIASFVLVYEGGLEIHESSGVRVMSSSLEARVSELTDVRNSFLDLHVTGLFVVGTLGAGSNRSGLQLYSGFLELFQNRISSVGPQSQGTFTAAVVRLLDSPLVLRVRRGGAGVSTNGRLRVAYNTIITSHTREREFDEDGVQIVFGYHTVGSVVFDSGYVYEEVNESAPQRWAVGVRGEIVVENDVIRAKAAGIEGCYCGFVISVIAGGLDGGELRLDNNNLEVVVLTDPQETDPFNPLRFVNGTVTAGIFCAVEGALTIGGGSTIIAEGNTLTRNSSTTSMSELAIFIAHSFGFDGSETFVLSKRASLVLRRNSLFGAAGGAAGEESDSVSFASIRYPQAKFESNAVFVIENNILLTRLLNNGMRLSPPQTAVNIKDAVTVLTSALNFKIDEGHEQVLFFQNFTISIRGNRFDLRHSRVEYGSLFALGDGGRLYFEYDSRLFPGAPTVFINNNTVLTSSMFEQSVTLVNMPTAALTANLSAYSLRNGMYLIGACANFVNGQQIARSLLPRNVTAEELITADNALECGHHGSVSASWELTDVVSRTNLVEHPKTRVISTSTGVSHTSKLTPSLTVIRGCPRDCEHITVIRATANAVAARISMNDTSVANSSVGVGSTCRNGVPSLVYDAWRVPPNKKDVEESNVRHALIELEWEGIAPLNVSLIDAELRLNSSNTSQAPPKVETARSATIRLERWRSLSPDSSVGRDVQVGRIIVGLSLYFAEITDQFRVIVVTLGVRFNCPASYQIPVVNGTPHWDGDGETTVSVAFRLIPPEMPPPALSPVSESATVAVSVAAGVVSGGSVASDLQTVALLGLSACSQGAGSAKKGRGSAGGLALRALSPSALSDSCEGAVLGNFMLIGVVLVVQLALSGYFYLKKVSPTERAPAGTDQPLLVGDAGSKGIDIERRIKELKITDGVAKRDSLGSGADCRDRARLNRQRRAFLWQSIFDTVRFPSFLFTLMMFLQNGFLLCGVELLRHGNGYTEQLLESAAIEKQLTVDRIGEGTTFFIHSANGVKGLAVAGLIFGCALPIGFAYLVSAFLSSRAYYSVYYRLHSGSSFKFRACSQVEPVEAKGQGLWRGAWSMFQRAVVLLRNGVVSFALPRGVFDSTVRGTLMFLSVSGKFSSPQPAVVLLGFASFIASLPFTVAPGGQSCGILYGISVVLHIIFAIVFALLRPFPVVILSILAPLSLLLNAVLIVHYLLLLDDPYGMADGVAGDNASSAWYQGAFPLSSSQDPPSSALYSTKDISRTIQILAALQIAFTALRVAQRIFQSISRFLATRGVCRFFEPYVGSCEWEVSNWPNTRASKMYTVSYASRADLTEEELQEFSAVLAKAEGQRELESQQMVSSAGTSKNTWGGKHDAPGSQSVLDAVLEAAESLELLLIDGPDSDARSPTAAFNMPNAECAKAANAQDDSTASQQTDDVRNTGDPVQISFSEPLVESATRCAEALSVSLTQSNASASPGVNFSAASLGLSAQRANPRGHEGLPTPNVYADTERSGVFPGANGSARQEQITQPRPQMSSFRTVKEPTYTVNVPRVTSSSSKPFPKSTFAKTHTHSVSSRPPLSPFGKQRIGGSRQLLVAPEAQADSSSSSSHDDSAISSLSSTSSSENDVLPHCSYLLDSAAHIGLQEGQARSILTSTSTSKLRHGDGLEIGQSPIPFPFSSFNK